MGTTDISAIFKAYDIRGKVGSELTPELAKNIGRALADWLPNEGTVAVGRDMRPDSAELANALISGLTQQGRDVIDIGLVTSDMIYFAVGHYGLAGGAIITASHNPGEYNGIKLCREEAKPIGAESGLFEIRGAALNTSFKETTPAGEVQQQDITEDWINHNLSFIDARKLKPFRIAVDAGNGMAGKIFPELEPYVPFEVHEMYFELDGTFPNHEANPLNFETLADMIAVIKKEKLDFGIAFDGDGDRAFLVDDTGTVVTGGIMSSILARHFLKKHPGANIVYDIRNSRSVAKIIRENGGTPVVERVGHSFIKETMRKVDAPFGGEASGHYYFRDNWYADSGLIAAVIATDVLSHSGKKLSELRMELTRYAAIPETNFIVEDKGAVLQALTEAFPDQKPNLTDGLTIEFASGAWFNLRGSNTEPVMRLNAEAKTQEELDSLVEKVTRLIK